MHYFSLFSKNFKTRAKVSAFGRKTPMFEKGFRIFDENSIKRLFILFLENIHCKNGSFVNSIRFLQQFSPFRGNFPPIHTWLRHFY